MEIKTLFDNEFKNVHYNGKMNIDVAKFVRVFMHKGENSAFFGSGLLAVHRVRWTSTENNGFFDDILKIDPDELKDKIDALNNIDPNHVATTDAFNLSIIYSVHRAMTEKSLSPAQKKELSMNLLRLLFFKFICSLLTNYFPHGADIGIAMRTFESMNNRYDLRVYKTWQNLITARAESIIAPSSIHYKTLINFDNDESVKYVLSDIQTRIRVLIKTLTSLYYKVRAEGDRIVTNSSLIEVEGGTEIKDVKRQFPKYRRYLFDTVPDLNSFLRPQLTDVIIRLIPSMNKKLFLNTLNYISVHFEDKKGIKIQSFLDKVLEYSFDYINATGINPNHLPEVLNGIKGILNASLNKEQSVMYLRTTGDSIVKEARGQMSKSSVPVSSERTGVILYIVLRTLTMNHYQN